jgi:hypothetical protein
MVVCREEGKRLCGAMKNVGYPALLSAALLLATIAAGAESIYKSVDREGRVTYSSQPPSKAARIEAVKVPPTPSAEATDEAIKRIKETKKETDARFKELMESRQQRAEERKEARERKRLETEAAERQQRYDEALEQLRRPALYYPLYPRYWPYPPQPPVHPLHPPGPAPVPNKPYHSHINTPARNW